MKPAEAPPVDSLPIDLVSISDVTKSKQGSLKAEKQPEPEKQVEKKAEPKEKVDPNLPVKQKEVKSHPPRAPNRPKRKKSRRRRSTAKPDPAPSEDAIAKKARRAEEGRE